MTLSAQSNTIILKLRKDKDSQELKDLPGVQSVESIFEDLRLYALHLYKGLDKEASLNRKLNALSDYIHSDIQLEERRIPNDPDYPAQWALRQIGMEKAWDLTTGGKTVTGKDIVVAILDDGFQVDHPDYKENIWVNTGEVPNNGIDDDLNGFIDDYTGWNATLGNDQHRVLNHGTSVAGIVGAKSDNNRQISGVNWNVKLMLISGGRSDNISLVDIVKAYDYIYRQRKLYNETKGQKGAYVVVSNYSGGAADKFPQDFPSWCEIYDALGKVGVLNIGSAPNTNTNIDIEGDLPGTCPSDYLIIVTNTDRNDNKVQNAGFGTTGVDLGAPGDDIFTLAVNGATDPDFSGTSAAAPHVAGVISLMYSLICEEFYNQSLESPSEIATIMKNALINSVQPLSTLAGLVRSSGRLDALKSLQSIDTRLGDCCEVTLDELINSEESCSLAGDASLQVKASAFDLGDSLLYELKNNQWSFLSPNGNFNRIQNGDYTLRVYDRSNPECSAESVVSFAISPEVCPFGDFEIKDISPNPVAGKLVIRYDLDEQKDVQFFIYDMTGRKLYAELVRPDITSDRKHIINVSDLPAGMYNLSLFANGQIDTKRFLKLY